MIISALLLCSWPALFDGNSLNAGEGKAPIALVIGNSDYERMPLKNPVNDARDMTAMLKKMGFKVLFEENATQRKMESAIREFGKMLRNEKIGLFYYAGHGMQIQGRNYLLPVDANINYETDVKYEAVHAGRVLDAMYNAGNELNIVILDACRDNPFARSFRSAERGLARMDAPTGTLIAYATSPGNVASDGTGKNGIYTKHLLKNIPIRGLTVEQVFKRVRVGVIKDTSNRQVPWESSSLTGDFQFNPGAAPTVYQPSASIYDNLPPETDNFGAYEGIIKKRKQSKSKWLEWQEKMANAYAKADTYDDSSVLMPTEKQGLWKSFIATYNVENPYSEKDNELRKNAHKKLAYWSEPKTHTQAPEASTPAPKAATQPEPIDVYTPPVSAPGSGRVLKLAILPWQCRGAASYWKKYAISAISELIRETDMAVPAFSYYDLGKRMELKYGTKRIKDVAQLSSKISDKSELWIATNEPNVDVICDIGKRLKVDMALVSSMFVQGSDPPNGRIRMFLINVHTKDVYAGNKGSNSFDQYGFRVSKVVAEKIFSDYKKGG